MEWIEEIKRGDEAKLKAYFDQYRPVILKASQTFYLRNFELDDWIQEGLIVFYRSALTYNGGLGVSFGLYFKNNFHRHIISLIRKQKALKRKGDEEATSLDDETKGETQKNSYLHQVKEDNLAEDLYVKDCSEEVFKSLSETEKDALFFYNQGFGTYAISVYLKLSEEETKKLLQKIKQKFKKGLK